MLALLPLLLAVPTRAAQEAAMANTLDRVTIDVSGDGKLPLVMEVVAELPPPLHYSVTAGPGGPLVVPLTEPPRPRAGGQAAQVIVENELQPLHHPKEGVEEKEQLLSVNEEKEQVLSVNEEKEQQPLLSVNEEKQEVSAGEGVNEEEGGGQGRVECPVCLCTLGGERGAYVVEGWTAGNRTDPHPTTTTPTTTTTTTTTTTSTTTTTTSTTTTSTTTSTTTTTTTTTTKPPSESPSSSSSSCFGDRGGEVCLSESCVMAAGTILNSLDRSVSPCDDFYQFSCGGWAQRSPALNMDRFQAIDKRNQNIIRSVLESAPPANVSEAEQKARTFYHSCMRERESSAPEDLLTLQAVVEFAGGWQLSGQQNTSMDLTERLYRLQNQLGVSALFTWGVIAENATTHIAVVPGGWMEDQLEEPSTYLKLMAGISWLLAEAAKCPVTEYSYGEVLEKAEVVNDSVEVDYEYEYGIESPRFTGIFDLFSSMFSGSEATVVTPGDYYDYKNYDFIHETNDTEFLNPDMYEDEEGSSLGPSPLVLEEATPATPEARGPHLPTAQEDLPQKSLRAECMDRLKSEMELGGEAMAALVAQRLDLEEAMRAVQALEHRLRNLTTSGPDSTDGALTPITLASLQTEHGFISWIPFLQRAFQIIDHQLSEDTVILINQEYLRGLTMLVEEYSASTATMEVMRNYLTWRLVAQFYPSQSGYESRRGEQCLKQTEDVFGPVVTAMYVRHKTIEASKSLVEEVDMMVDTMKEAFSTTLRTLPWMSEDSRTAALHKLANMMDLIGYPEQVLNGTWLNAKYSEVEVTDDYLMNIVAFQSHQRKEGMKLFTRPYQRGSWAEMAHGGSIVTVNAFYSPNSNTMIVPIGMLQDPLYWNQPKSLTFGAFGIVVAHEITHAFDDSGINYNSDGRATQLYDEATIAAFHQQASCLATQYSGYSIAEARVDGNLTLGENLADHGGLRMALAAYSRWRSSHIDYRLPALPFDDMQLFFIGYALPWCARHTKKHSQSQVENDEHAPERFRVLGPLSNSPEFSAAFHCPLGSTMNPVEKCSVW